ncbi:MAG: hypothetical protein AAGC68_14795, partial [Verrucomicrobiota bacterium]
PIFLKTLALAPIFAAESSSPQEFPSFSELEDQVDSLRIEEIAWRRIKWKHCILEGLAASREEGKPILFWCHIDLPADDKRC